MYALSISRLFYCLQLEQSRFEELEETVAEMKLKQLLWDSLDEWDKIYQTWLSTEFLKLDPEEAAGVTAKYVKSVAQLEKGLPPNAVVPLLKEKVESMKEKVRGLLHTYWPK
ncbi:unnamed protein product [Protopolystoma xenopodis]|uniref:Dynein heavy chain linker domain-containing protein n=1 Tax=Protopolystoma xenopodis TaxID=117903 RepID=A0A448XPN1_9PLAT|nr:unnamed protein product [Protopolystoma xenopodis]